MTTENTTPDATQEQEAPRKTIRSIKAATKSAKGTIGARRSAAERLPRTADLPATEETVEPVVAAEAPAGKRWLAYMGPEETKVCYRTSDHLTFKPQPFSAGHPVALVSEAFGDELIKFGVLKTYANGKARAPEDWVDAYQWLDDVIHSKMHAARRYGAVV